MKLPIKVVSWLSWVGIVLFGLALLIFIRPQQPAAPAPNATAAADLPLNTLLRGDLQNPGFSGRYIVAAAGVKAGNLIKAQDVGDAPIPPGAPPAKLLLIIPVEGTANSIDLQVGSKHKLCSASPDELATVTVQFVHCADGDDHCSATLEVPLYAAANVAAGGLNADESVNALHLADSCSP
jgi:hypothetical protein